MKKIIIILLAAIMCLVAPACSAFGSRTGKFTPVTPDDDSDQSDSGGDDDDDPGADIKPELENAFTVTCTFEGERVKDLYGYSVRWTGTDGGVYTADFDSEGVAACEKSAEMDGEFAVSLNIADDAYVYRPDYYTADNENRHVNIELYEYITVDFHEISKVNIEGGDVEPLQGGRLNEIKSVTAGNVYKATLNIRKDDAVYFFMSVSRCVLETWCSIADDVIDPTITAIRSSSVNGLVMRSGSVVCKDGGKRGNFTSNVRLSLVDNPLLAGHNLFYLTASYYKTPAPTTVDVYFYVSEATESVPDPSDPNPPVETKYEKVTIKSAELLKKLQPSEPFSYCYERSDEILRSSDFKLFEKGTTDALGNTGDGYYHYYNAETNVYGEIVFAMLTHDCTVINTEGNNAGFRFGMINVRCNGRDYAEFFGEVNSATGLRGWLEGEKTPVNGSAPEIKGYAKFANRDGAHPVTEELKQFLQDYASAERLFFDGEGWAENGMNPSKLHLKAGEYDQWLFCCGFYEGCNNVSDFTEVNPDEA